MTDRVNLRIRKGETFRKVIYWANRDSSGTLSGISMSGATARSQIRETTDSDSFIAEMTTANGGITLSNLASPLSVTDSDGVSWTLPTGTAKVELYLSDTATAAWTATKGVWDLEVILGSGDVRAPFKGSVAIASEVTR